MVIMDVNNYVRETERQPNNSKNYKVLTKAPTITNSNLVNQTINRFKKEQLINESIASGNESPRTSQFYISPIFTKKKAQVALR